MHNRSSMVAVQGPVLWPTLAYLIISNLMIDSHELGLWEWGTYENGKSQISMMMTSKTIKTWSIYNHWSAVIDVAQLVTGFSLDIQVWFLVGHWELLLSLVCPERKENIKINFVKIIWESKTNHFLKMRRRAITFLYCGISQSSPSTICNKNYNNIIFLLLI
jgi:hypothetical protein